MDCPSCASAHTEVVESRLCTNGTRRRRYGCLDCQHRWTTWDGPRQKKGPAGHRASNTRKARKVTPEAVQAILLAPRDEGHRHLGNRLGISAEMARQVRYGQAHASVHPELARWGQPLPETVGRSCYNCGEWSDGRCSFGFPEPVAEGPTFARECPLYAP